MPDPGELMKGFRVGHWTVLPERGLLREVAGYRSIEAVTEGILSALAVEV